MIKIYNKEQFIWKIRNYYVLVISITKGMFWFRLFGYGLCIKNLKFHSLLFSEREGHGRCYQIGNWFFKLLK